MLGRLILLVALLMIPSAQLWAATFKITDRDGNPVKDVVILFEDYKSSGSDVLASAEMSQTERKFSPHVLVVPKNTPVTFPNYDNISHHVYSFSDAKKFEKKLYKGVEEAPVIFDKAGVVELGCNVHDWMLAYIYVTESSHFGITDDNGSVNVNLPKSGEHNIKLWHPRMDEADQQMRTLTVSADSNTIQLTRNISAEEEFDFDEFGDY